MDFNSSTLLKAAALDHPEINRFLFHPRKAPAMSTAEGVDEDLIEIDNDVAIGSRLHLGDKRNPNILFFHGNGEIAHDYDDIGPVYLSHGLNFIVADYRGYGISTGSPSVSSMLSDAYIIFDHICSRLDEKGYSGPVWIMGRSLGSAPAIEVAANRKERVAGLIVESGFAGVEELLTRLGMFPGSLGVDRNMFFSNADNIKNFKSPALIIHAENDHIIPLDHGKQLYESTPAVRKLLRIIKGADHNNIFHMAGLSYFENIKDFIYKDGSF